MVVYFVDCFVYLLFVPIIMIGQKYVVLYCPVRLRVNGPLITATQFFGGWPGQYSYDPQRLPLRGERKVVRLLLTKTPPVPSVAPDA